MIFVRGLFRASRWRRLILLTLLLIPASLYLYYDNYRTSQRLEVLRHTSYERLNPVQEISPAGRRQPTVNLVVASLLSDDISWIHDVTSIPNLNVIRYVSDYLGGPYHPPVAKKGYEALIYHAYLHDFYDDLPDISIMIHATETSWHVEDMLNRSMTFALNNLDLGEVQQAGYFNLRVTWEGACPDWINTLTPPDRVDKRKPEEPYVRQAFVDNFDDFADVPEIVAGPCCSQFAVTRDAVRTRPRAQYRRNMDWLVRTKWSNDIAGRVWEHMWPWLFKGVAVDCAIEWRAYCRMYHVCLDLAGRDVVDVLEEEKEELKTGKIGFWKELLDPQGGLDARRRLVEIDDLLRAELEKAVERGRDQDLRLRLLSDLYTG